MKEFRVKDILSDALKDAELKLYLPDLEAPASINRKFLYNVSNNIAFNLFTSRSSTLSSQTSFHRTLEMA
jgi:hypothetical protein